MTARGLTIGVHLIRRRILDAADRHGGEAAHSSVFRCRSGFEAMSAHTRGSRARFVVWDEAEPADDFVARCDVLVGVPDIRLLNARARSAHRPPYLAMVMGDATRAVPWTSPLMARLQSNDTLVCTCEADTRILREFLDVPEPSGLDVAPMPGDLSRFFEGRPPAPAAVEALRGVGPDRPVVLSAERLTEQKGVHRLVPLVAGLRDRGHRPVLVVLGSRTATNDYQRAITGQLAAAGLLDSVVWMPFLTPDELAALYARSTLVVSASTIYDNNFGYVPIESMAVGTPPVVTAWGGYRDSVVAGVTGIHIPTTLHPDLSVSVDVEASVRAADELLGDASAYERVSRAARERAADRFSVPATARRYTELAEVALARREADLPPWTVNERGRAAVRLGWTDRVDNPDRTGRVRRSAPGRSARETDEMHELEYRIYRHYATEVEPVAAPAGLTGRG